MSIIYDFGANIGSNIPYYLLKADKVVAVEANPLLVKELEKQYSSEIADGRLYLVNRAVTTETGALEKLATFFMYDGNDNMGHVGSSLVQPLIGPQNYKEVEVRLTHPAELFAEYGNADFVKIDLEHHDFAVLEGMLGAGCIPPYLSVEAHDPRVLGLLLLEERFLGFKLVRGSRVHKDFVDLPVVTDHGLRRVTFARHSAGPFGDDIPGHWLNRSSLVQQFGYFGPGWIDIHVTTRQVGRDVARPSQALPTGAGELASLSVVAAGRAISTALTAILRRARAALQ